MDTSGHELYFAHQRAVQTIHGIATRYRLAHRRRPLRARPRPPEHSIRVRAGDAELLIRSEEWLGRRAELEEHVLAWLLEYVDLRAARPRPGARRYDEWWMRAWRDANPSWRRARPASPLRANM